MKCGVNDTRCAVVEYLGLAPCECHETNFLLKKSKDSLYILYIQIFIVCYYLIAILKDLQDCSKNSCISLD